METASLLWIGRSPNRGGQVALGKASNPRYVHTPTTIICSRVRQRIKHTYLPSRALPVLPVLPVLLHPFLRSGMWQKPDHSHPSSTSSPVPCKVGAGEARRPRDGTTKLHHAGLPGPCISWEGWIQTGTLRTDGRTGVPPFEVGWISCCLS